MVLSFAYVFLVAASFVCSTTHQITTKDGAKIQFTVDKIVGHLWDGKRKSAMVDTSPYGATHLAALADLFGLIFDSVPVRAEYRGTYGSGGVFDTWAHAASDTNETFTWLAEQSWSNGVIQQVGGSADGVPAILAYKNSEPRKFQLGKAFLIWATGNVGPTLYPGGAFRESLAGMLRYITTDKTRPDASQYLLDLEDPRHEAYEQFNMNDQDYANVKEPVVMWAAWYDIFSMGNLVNFDGFQQKSHPDARGKSYLIVEPAGHCQDPSLWLRDTILGHTGLGALAGIFNFMGKKIPDKIGHITFYVMGPHYWVNDKSVGNYWTTMDSWPVPEFKPLYLSADMRLTFELNETKSANLSYAYDPKNPVKTQGGNNMLIRCGALDQRSVEQSKRKDVLTFTSAPVQDNMAVTGPLTVRLFVSSDAKDTDFTAKLTDVYPEGKSILIQDGIQRMRWREPQKGPQLMEPGKVYEIEISLWNTSYVFNRGHRFRVSVSSSNAPRFDVNPNNGFLRGRDGPLVTATNTIHVGPETPSSILLPMVTMSQLPKADVNAIYSDFGTTVDAVKSIAGYIAKSLLSFGRIRIGG